MEFLVLKVDGWMDEGKNSERVSNLRLNANFEAKYHYRTRKHDFIEQQQDGYWTGKNKRGFRKDKFILITVKGFISDVMYGAPLCDTVVSTDPIPIKAHSYSINLDGVDTSGSSISLNKVEFESRLIKNG